MDTKPVLPAEGSGLQHMLRATELVCGRGRESCLTIMLWYISHYLTSASLEHLGVAYSSGPPVPQIAALTLPW